MFTQKQQSEHWGLDGRVSTKDDGGSVVTGVASVAAAAVELDDKNTFADDRTERRLKYKSAYTRKSRAARVCFTCVRARVCWCVRCLRVCVCLYRVELISHRMHTHAERRVVVIDDVERTRARTRSQACARALRETRRRCGQTETERRQRRRRAPQTTLALVRPAASAQLRLKTQKTFYT